MTNPLPCPTPKSGEIEAERSGVHNPNCPAIKARTCAVGIECEHGFDVCPICDRCTCGPFQPRVEPWMRECFGDVIPFDKIERADRFAEEAMELVQTTQGFTRDRAHALVDYVFDRAVGEPKQEVGGVMVTLAAYCLANGLDMHAAAETELARIWTKVPQIRAKQAAKPTGSALPVALRAAPASPAGENGRGPGIHNENKAEDLQRLRAALEPYNLRARLEEHMMLKWGAPMKPGVEPCQAIPVGLLYAVIGYLERASQALSSVVGEGEEGLSSSRRSDDPIAGLAPTGERQP